ncbi:MAG: ATP-dependent DNA ligase [Methanomassiliicoccales archaeon]|nr:ATP-dependent DNA ligase [Methanomassiliicoccales archaeon]NYT14608.1 ATP-dependent DNA ligase [Methanomassiliicoccales archaeon]
MLFRDLVEVFDSLESTASRLEMTDYLSDFFSRVSCNDIDKIVYLTQGKLFPDFYPEKLGIADKLLLKALAFTSGIKESEIQEIWLREGDPGIVAREVFGRKKQTALFSEQLTLNRVHSNLVRIARAEGSGSQDLKMKLLADILHDATPDEAKYLSRIVTGRMRLGVAAATAVDALSQAFGGKEHKPEVERAFNISSDLGMVAYTLCSEGLDGLSHLSVKVGNPIRAMLAERLASPEEILAKLGGTAAFEYKYDGVRVQAHISKDEIRLFSRRLEDLTPQFPDVVSDLRDAFTGGEAIVEGECVPIDINTGEMLPFQEVSHRRGRKYGLEDAIEDYPVRIFLFDCLYLDGEDLTERPLSIRRKALEGIIDQGNGARLSEMRILEDTKEVENFFNRALQDGCEGLMAKSIGEGSVYRAGARGFLWIKYKKEYRSEMTDTVDLVAVGAFAGRGRRGGVYGALLMATYNEQRDKFETVCKLGSGFDDEFLAALPGLLEPYKESVKHHQVESKMDADFWFEPSLVLEVLGSEISLSPIHTAAFSMIREGAGLAIRFPRFTGRTREDKGPREATSSEELEAMYKHQLKRVES